MSGLLIFFAVNLYSLALQFARVFVAPFVPRRLRDQHWHLKDRFRLPPARKDFRNSTIEWLHASSIGESKVLVEFLRLLADKHPDHLYVATATTASGVAFLEKCRHHAICATGFLPLDTIAAMKAIIDRFSVKRVWLMETELWPSLLYVCMVRGIPVCMANARLEERSFRTYRRFGFLFRPLLLHVRAALVQDESYAKRFEALGVARDRIAVTGNIKSRIVVRRPAYDEWRVLRRDLGLAENATVITAGCMHDGEGRTLREALTRIHRAHPSWRLIVVPRYLEEVPALENELGPEAVTLQEPRTTRDWQVCIVAAFGVMEDMYRIADVAVVGGTFIDVGGHNVWEAAQFGIPVLWGPDYHTQRQSCARLLDAGVGFSVRDGRELGAALIRVLKTDARAFIRAELAFMEKSKETTTALESAIP